MKGRALDKINWWVWLIPFLFVTGLRVEGQTAEKVVGALVEEGFENVRAIYLEDSQIFTFENSVYRSDVDALRQAMVLVSDRLPLETFVRLLLLEKDVPRLVLSFRAGEWKRYLSGSLPRDSVSNSVLISEDTHEVWSLIRKEKPHRSGAGKTDLVIYPQFSFENTLKARLYTTQLNIAPAVQINLLRGMQLTGQVIIPVHNEMGYEGDFVRPGQVVLSQEIKSRRLLGRVAVGNFNAGRYGGDVNVRFLLPDENWSLKANAGLTGNSHFLDRRWINGPLNTFTWSLTGTWFIPRFDVELEGGTRQYVYGDTGLYGSMTRWFGETGFGFYAMASDVSKNGGFFISIPLPLKKRPRHRYFRVTLPDHYEMVYNGGTEFYYGQSYGVLPGVNRVKGFLRASFVRNELLKL